MNLNNEINRIYSQFDHGSELNFLEDENIFRLGNSYLSSGTNTDNVRIEYSDT